MGNIKINSNTSAEGFVRLICQNNKNNTNKAYDNDLSPNKNRFNKNIINKNEYLPLKEFKELFQSHTVQELIKIGSKPGPLTLIGEFLQLVGRCIISIITGITNNAWRCL